MPDFINSFTELPLNLILPIGLAIALYFTYKLAYAHDKDKEERKDNKGGK